MNNSLLLFFLPCCMAVVIAASSLPVSDITNHTCCGDIPRHGDKLQPPVSNSRSGSPRLDPEGKIAVVPEGVFSTDRTADISAYISNDTLSFILNATRHRFKISSGSLSYLGFENRATRMELDSAFAVCSLPLSGGTFNAAPFTGNVWHHGRTLLRKVSGLSESSSDSGWSIVCGEDTIKGATRLSWKMDMATLDPDSVGEVSGDTLFSPSVSDLGVPVRRMLVERILTERDIWLVPEARYPVLASSKVSLLRQDGTEKADTVPMSFLSLYYPTELQAIDTGEEYSPSLSPDKARGASLEPYGDGKLSNGIPVVASLVNSNENSVTIELGHSEFSSHSSSSEATLTFLSVSGLRLSEPMKTEIGSLPQKVTLPLPSGASGVILLRVDCGAESATYKLIR